MDKWQKVFEQYRWEQEVTDEAMLMLPEYPHIYTANIDGVQVVVKETLSNKCFSPDDIFKNLPNDKKILFPLLTKNGSYYAKIKESNYLIYPRIQQINEYPSPEWWADCLQMIHSVPISQQMLSQTFVEDAKKTENLLNVAIPYIESDVYCQLQSLFTLGLKFSTNTEKKHVLCHGDPSQWNVLKDLNGYKLIDIENCFLAPLEYDIQHLFWSYAAVCYSMSQWENFADCFLTNYKKKRKVNIDFCLLTRLFCMDFVKTVAWLYLVSNDQNRGDRSRQANELILYCNMIRKKWPFKMIDFFKEISRTEIV